MTSAGRSSRRIYDAYMGALYRDRRPPEPGETVFHFSPRGVQSMMK